MLASVGAAYLKGDPLASGFVGSDFRDPLTVRKTVEARTLVPLDPSLIGLLQRQQAALFPSEQRSHHLSLLQTSATQPVGVVVTGQQVGLFLGPLYTVYKAATAIVAAQALTQQTGTKVVPLFWLQTEDHDYEEIRSCSIPSSEPGQPPLVLSLLASDPAFARTSVAYRRLGSETGEVLSALSDQLRGLPYAAECLSLLRRHYVQGHTLAQAFAGLLAEIFAPEGLLFLDPRQEGETTLPKLAAPLYERVLLDHAVIRDVLQKRERALRADGFACQVPVRPTASLLFYYPDGEKGPRYRLEQGCASKGEQAADPQSALWSVPRSDPSRDPSGSGNHLFSQKELLSELHTAPLCFGTSALLRPLLQDTILPTVAYVGGPAELSYFAQIAPLYSLLGIPQPVIMPRARVRITCDTTRKLLAKLGLTAADLEAPKAAVLHKRMQLSSLDPATGFMTPATLQDRLLAQLCLPLAEVEAIDPALRDAVDRARNVMEKTAQKIAARYAQRLHERDAVTSERIDRIQSFLFPSDTPQERVFSLPYFLARYGLFEWKRRLFSCLTLDSVFSADQSVRELAL